MRWTDWRTKIQELEKLGNVNTGTFTLSNSGLNWLFKYLGDATNLVDTFKATWIQGQTSITLTTSPTLASGYKFRTGDFIQLGPTGKVYNVVEDVAFNSNTVKLHRPILDATNATPANLKIGPNCSFTVQCSQFPGWSLMARDQVSWDGPFVLVENIA